MRLRPSSPPSWLTLTLGLALGWGIASVRPPAIHAQGGDRSGESVLTSGPIRTRLDGNKVPISQDALYYLDYQGGRLLAAVPTLRQVGEKARVIDDFAERDLVKDFQLRPGTNPRFLMTTGALGAQSDGWAPLYVIETTTGQVATYRVQGSMVGDSSRARFDLLERRPIRRPSPAP